MKFLVFQLITLIVIFIMFHVCVAAESSADEPIEQASQVKSYRNPKERREAGLGTQVSDWMKISGLMEIEQDYSKLRFSQQVKTTETPTTAALQIGLNILPAEWFEAELIFDGGYDQRYQSKIDVAMIAVNLNDWGLRIGKQYLPFGKYYSHFVTGPILEFGETRKTSLIIKYSFRDVIEVKGFLFGSEIDKQGNSNKIDWGLSLEAVLEDGAITFGAGLLSDLSETNEPLLANQKTYQRRVSGWNAYLLVGFEAFEFTAETLQATRTFKEFESVPNKPSSYNIELAYFPTESLQFAARVAHSRKLADNPRWQFGVQSTWRFNTNFSFSLDYLYGKFKNEFVLNDADDDLEYSHLIASLVVIEF